jgi:hypothetical protein
MENLKCLSTIVTNDLAVHIDISDLGSWNLNTGHTVVSLSKWKNAISEDIVLPDFGLTGFDNGRARYLYDSLSISANDTKLRLYPIGYNNATGGTFFTPSGITPVVSGVTPFVGRHFNLNGGYLQGFFKLEDYNYELLPARYGAGFTIETILRFDSDSFNNGFFYYMGTRAEDKYLPAFSGESGVYTSEKNPLDSYSNVEEVKKAITVEPTEIVRKINDGKEIYDNVLGLQILSDRTIAITKVNKDGVLQSYNSNKTVDTGWTIISLSFKPYKIITDKEILKCAPNRLGDLSIYLNGRLFWKIEDFEEFYCKPIDNDKEKQLGVPYNISFGGGSFGLQHSYHYDYRTYELYLDEDQTYLNTHFDEAYLSSIDPCIDNAAEVTGFTEILSIVRNDSTFVLTDCGIDTPRPVMQIRATGSTSGTTRFAINYNSSLPLLSNREYVFKFNLYEVGMFDLTNSEVNKIGLSFSGQTAITVVEEFAYLADRPGQWVEVLYKIKTADNSKRSLVNVGITVESELPLVSGFTFYIDDFKYIGQDILRQDPVKDNKMIEKNFSVPFRGGIQKLRIYDKALNSQEILHNAIIESENLGYALRITKGGRIINL